MQSYFSSLWSLALQERLCPFRRAWFRRRRAILSIPQRYL